VSIVLQVHRAERSKDAKRKEVGVRIESKLGEGIKGVTKRHGNKGEGEGGMVRHDQGKDQQKPLQLGRTPVATRELHHAEHREIEK